MDLGGCARLTSAGLCAVLEASAGLRDVDLRGCALLTDEVLLCSERCLPALRTLTVRCCGALTAEGVARLRAANAGRVRVIHVAADEAGVVSVG